MEQQPLKPPVKSWGESRGAVPAVTSDARHTATATHSTAMKHWPRSAGSVRPARHGPVKREREVRVAVGRRIAAAAHRLRGRRWSRSAPSKTARPSARARSPCSRPSPGRRCRTAVRSPCHTGPQQRLYPSGVRPPARTSSALVVATPLRSTPQPGGSGWPLRFCTSTCSHREATTRRQAGRQGRGLPCRSQPWWLRSPA
jgi:hypothetical protein